MKGRQKKGERMKHLKLLAVTAMAAAAVFAAVGAGTAAAETVLCTQSASPCPAAKADGEGTEIKASLVAGTKSKITAGFKTIECGKSSITAKVTSTGEKIGAGVEGLSFEECSCEVKVLAKGTLELEHIAGSANATAKSTGTEVTTECSTIFGNVHCIYKTEATDLGTLEGGNPAKLKVSVELPRLTTSALCNEKSLWEAEYEVSRPKPLFVEPEARHETVLCTESAVPCPAAKADGEGTEIKASLVSGTKSVVDSGGFSMECKKSSITAKVTSTGKTIGTGVEGLSFEECGGCGVSVLKKGTLELEHIASTANATVKSTGTEVTTNCNTIFGTAHCIYKTEATDLGTLEGGNPAKLKVSVELPRLATSSLCNEKSLWEAEYEVTSPKPLYVEPE
jgi:hypothetical protein